MLTVAIYEPLGLGRVRRPTERGRRQADQRPSCLPSGESKGIENTCVGGRGGAVRFIYNDTPCRSKPRVPWFMDTTLQALVRCDDNVDLINY
jgi:hypothetical protein